MTNNTSIATKDKLLRLFIIALNLFAVGSAIIFGFSFYPSSSDAENPKSTITDFFRPGHGYAITHKEIQAGDTLYSLLKSYGFDEAQVRVILGESILPKRFALTQGDMYRVIRDPKNKRLGLMLFDRKSDVGFAYWREKAKAGSIKIPINYRVEKKAVSGKVVGSLIASIKKEVDDVFLAYRFMDAYTLDYNLPKVLQRGAKFALTYEKKFDGPYFIKFGEIVHTEIEINGEMVRRQFVRYPDGGTFVGSLNTHKERPFYAPVDYLHFSSLFKPGRFHPIKRRRQAHLGVDFALPEGENVYTIYNGKVLRKGRTRGAGFYVVIRHPNGLESYYNHLSSIADGIQPGVQVSNGKIIGYVGCTGYCTKAHLHLALKKNGRFINPVSYLKSYPFKKRHLVMEAVEKRLASTR